MDTLQKQLCPTQNSPPKKNYNPETMPMWVFEQAQISGQLLETYFQAVLRQTPESFFHHWDLMSYGKEGQQIQFKWFGLNVEKL